MGYLFYIFYFESFYLLLIVTKWYFTQWFAMRKTKLEMYVGVLKILAQNDLAKTCNVADELNISTDDLKKYLVFLLKQGFIYEQKLSNNVVYLITKRGNRVLKYFNELKQELPITKGH